MEGNSTNENILTKDEDILTEDERPTEDEDVEDSISAHPSSRSYESKCPY